MKRIWLVRLGRHGEHEAHALDTGEFVLGFGAGDLTQAAGSTITLVREGEWVPEGRGFVRLAADHTRIYQDGWVVK